VEELLSGFWPDRLYVQSNGPQRSSLLEAVPEFASAEQALAAYGPQVRLSKKGGPYGLAPTGTDALQAYRAGFTCVMLSIEDTFPVMKELVVDAAEIFGVPVSAVKCEAFCSSGSSGLSMHSDFDLNFALLLQGKKRWHLAENASIENQTSICFDGRSVQPDQNQVRYAHSPFPDEMPGDCVDVEVKSGGLLFIPRGWWHETYSTGDCLQVNLTIKGPHWAGVFSRALEFLLLEEPDWRAYAYGLASEGAPREVAINELATRLDRLRRDYARADMHAMAARLLTIVDLESMTIGSQRKALRRASGAVTSSDSIPNASGRAPAEE